uniref:Extended synaptotagmin-like protein 2 n=1 Tax=Xenopus tropicalis TaxID=8364 RepID=A0A6I8SE87_XENTR
MINNFIIKYTIAFFLAFLHGRSDMPALYAVACIIARCYLTREEERIPARHEETAGNRKSFRFLAIVFLGYYLGKINAHIGYIALGLLVFWWIYCDEDPQEERAHTEEEETVVTAHEEKEEDEPEEELNDQVDRKNKLLAEVWPYFNRYLKNFLIEWHQPRICAMSIFLRLFRFLEFDLGEKPPRITAVRFHRRTEKEQIVLDLDIIFDGPIEVEVALFKRFLKLGANHIELRGTVRVILGPLLDEIPLFGAVTWYLPDRPATKIKWTGTVTQIPRVKKLLDKAANKFIDYFFVEPVHTSTKMWKEVDVDVLHFKVPKNVIRVRVLEAEDLASRGFIAKRFRPYVVVSGAGKKGKTKLAKRSLNPSWNQVYEMIFTDLPLQKVKFDLFYREVGKTKLYGSCQFSLEKLLEQDVVDTWLPLQNAESGRLHVRMESISAVPDAAMLDQILTANEISRPIQIKAFSSTILFVKVQKGKDLQLNDSEEIPTARVELKIRDAKRKTKFRIDTRSPEWKQKFGFPLKDPRNEVLEVLVKDKANGQMGTMTVPLSNLITAQGLTMEGWFNLSELPSPVSSPKAANLLVCTSCEPAPLPLCPLLPLLTVTNLSPSLTSTVPSPPPTTPAPASGCSNVIRVRVLEAEDLASRGFIAKRFRPYVVVSGAGKKGKTKLAKRSLNPSWNQVYEMIFTDLPLQKVKFDLFYREVGKTKLYGSCQFSLEKLLEQDVVDTWLPLQNAESGRLHVRMESISAVPDAAMLDQILTANEISRPIQIKAFSSTILFVKVQKGKDLQLNDSEEIPTARVELKIRDAKRKTKFRIDTRSPEWKQKFGFPLKDPRNEVLEVLVKDKANGQMGTMTVPLSNLITAQGLTMEGWFNLHPTEPRGAVWMKLELRILSQNVRFPIRIFLIRIRGLVNQPLNVVQQKDCQL